MFINKVPKTSKTSTSIGRSIRKFNALEYQNIMFSDDVFSKILQILN